MQVAGQARLGGIGLEDHVGLLWRASRLLVVAPCAGSHHVVPPVSAATAERQHVVDREFLWPAAAVLALMAVSLEDILSRVPDARARSLDEIQQANDRRTVEGAGWGLYRGNAVEQSFGLAPSYEHECARHPCDSQRLPVLV